MHIDNILLVAIGFVIWEHSNASQNPTNYDEWQPNLEGSIPLRVVQKNHGDKNESQLCCPHGSIMIMEDIKFISCERKETETNFLANSTIEIYDNEIERSQNVTHEYFDSIEKACDKYFFEDNSAWKISKVCVSNRLLVDEFCNKQSVNFFSRGKFP